jgi:hypothetical protein
VILIAANFVFQLERERPITLTLSFLGFLLGRDED